MHFRVPKLCANEVGCWQLPSNRLDEIRTGSIRLACLVICVLAFVGLYGEWQGIFGSTTPRPLVAFSGMSPGIIVASLLMTLGAASTLVAVVVAFKDEPGSSQRMQRLSIWHTTTSVCLWTSVAIWLVHSPGFLAIESYGFMCSILAAIISSVAACSTKEGCCGCCHCGLDICMNFAQRFSTAGTRKIDLEDPTIPPTEFSIVECASPASHNTAQVQESTAVSIS